MAKDQAVRVTRCLRVIQDIREKTDSVACFYSGGKDSLVILDLLIQRFRRVVPVFMYLVKDLEHIKPFLEYPQKKYGVDVLQYPHWGLSGDLRRNRLKYFSNSSSNIPALTIRDIENAVRVDTGIEWMASGQRKSDSLDRRIMMDTYRMGAINDKSRRFFPIAEWLTRDVLKYIKMKKIIPPVSYRGFNNSGGVSLDYAEIKFIKEHFPNDYEKIKKVFPLVDLYQAKEDLNAKDEVSKI
ncbi:MAG: phosphoadenosine phosphosulfate reductase family protein [bacterium]|nr:phosphoadenosine phosphosulfate reductase family protein [bacterium]